MLLAFLLCCSAAQADETSGNELLSLCQGNPSLVAGYVIGVAETGSRDMAVVVSGYAVAPRATTHSQEEADAWVSRLKATTKAMHGYCFPDGVTRVQSKDVVCKYLRDNPSERHLSGTVLVRKAFIKAWPCAYN
jgi:hypothetical protein